MVRQPRSKIHLKTNRILIDVGFQKGARIESKTGPKAPQKHIRKRDGFWMIFGAKKEAKMEPE